MISRVIVFGATGFIGRHFIREVDGDSVFPVTRCLNKIIPADCFGNKWLVADLLDQHSIDNILAPGSTVVNLAESGSSSSEDNIAMVKNLVQACFRAKVSRLVHCSTAVLVGENPSSVVNENTKCMPVTSYERTKYQIESLLLDKVADDFKIYILRPTRVIGPGGENLKKLLFEIMKSGRIANYVRSSVFGNRNMNLVAVKDVVGALIHLFRGSSIEPGVYICSADDDPCNQYDNIEAIIRDQLKKQTIFKPIPLPVQILNVLLRFGRTGSGRFANRNYSSEKLFHTGFQREESVERAVREFVLHEAGCSKSSP